MRFYIFLIAFLFVSLSVSAQLGELRNQLSIGGNAGITLCNISFDPTIKQGMLQGKTGGITARYTCEKYFSTVCAIQAEINYAQMGWKENILDKYGEPLPDTYERHLNYIQVPLFARLSWGKERGGLMFVFMAGPQLGFNIGDSEKKSSTWTLNSEGNPDRPNNVYQQYGKKPENTFDYGLTGSIGIEFNTKKGQHIMVDGRYYYGLADIYKNGKKDPFSRSANTCISVRLTYLFNVFDY